MQHRRPHYLSAVWILIIVCAAGFSFGLGSFISHASVTVSGSGITGNSAFNSFTVPGTPPAAASSSLLELGPNAINGSASGTFIGINPISFSGNFLDFQVNSSSVFRVDGAGNLTASTITFGDGTTQTTAAGASPANGVLYAANFSGADAGAQIQACVTSASSATSKTCDAKGLDGGSISTTIAIPAGVTLIAHGTFTSSVLPVITVSNGTQLIGASGWLGGLFLHGPGGSGSIIQAASGGAQGAVIRNVRVGNTTALTSADGSIGFNLSGFINSSFYDDSAVETDTGFYCGSTSLGSSYYDVLMNPSTFNTWSYDFNFQNNCAVVTLIQPQAHGGISGQTGTHIGYNLASYSDVLVTPDAETGYATSVAFDVSGQGNQVKGPYCEGYGTCIKMESGATGNWITPGVSISTTNPLDISSETTAEINSNMVASPATNGQGAFVALRSEYYNMGPGATNDIRLGGAEVSGGFGLKTGMTVSYGDNNTMGYTGYAPITVGSVTQQDASLALSNGQNSTISLGLGNKTNGLYYITGVTADFDVCGFGPQPAGGTVRDIWLTYSGTHTLSLQNHNNSCTGGDQITTMTGGDVSIPGPFIVHLMWDPANNYWDLVSASGSRSLSGQLITTAATSDSLSLTGLSTSSRCTFSPQNAVAAADIANDYISAYTANSVTLTHTATEGMIYDFVCTVN